VGGDNDDTLRQVPGQNSGNNSLATHDPIAVGKRRKRERELNDARWKQITLLWVRNLIGTVSLASLLVFDWNSSLVLSHRLFGRSRYPRPAALLVHALSTPQPLHILARGLDDALGVVDCVKGGYSCRHLLSVKDAHSKEVNQRTDAFQTKQAQLSLNNKQNMRVILSTNCIFD
jgi:hypothetical protein